MEPDQIIERLGSDNPPSLEDLQSAQTELNAAQETLRESIREHSGTFAELRALKADYDVVTDALTKVDEALTEAEAEKEAILAEVGVETETPVEEVPAEDEPEVEAEAKPVAASATRETLARVRQTPRQVETVNEPDRLSEVSTTYTLMGKDAETIDPRMIGQAFADTKRKWGGTKTAVLSIKTDLHPDRTLSGDASANERKMLDLFGADPVIPVTAAGGCCSIPEPIYDQPLIGDLSRPIRGAFDVLNASRGAVQAYPPVCIPDAGADVWTCAQDEAVDPEDPLTWKACVAIACEDSAPTLVEPIFKCLTIGTFQQKFAPEQWEAIVFQTDKLAVRLAEARLFDWLVASATSTHTGFAADDTYVNFVRSLLRGAALIRQDQRLGDAQLVAVGPDWIYTAIAESTMTRRLVGADEIEVTRAKVDAVLRDFGISYVGSQDVADIEDFQYDGALADYPATAPVVLLPAGSAKVLDGGEKNLGIDVVDFDLARQNNVGAFSEFWEGLLVRNCNIKQIDIPIDVCGTVGACPT